MNIITLHCFYFANCGLLFLDEKELLYRINIEVYRKENMITTLDMKSLSEDYPKLFTHTTVLHKAFVIWAN